MLGIKQEVAERRGDIRLLKHLSVFVHALHTTHDGSLSSDFLLAKTLNISKSGILVRFGYEFKLDSPADISIKTDTGFNFVLETKVIWRRHANNVHDVGLQIIKNKATDFQMWQRFVEMHIQKLDLQ